MNYCNEMEENTASTLCNPCPYEYNCTRCKKETDKLARKSHKKKKSITMNKSDRRGSGTIYYIEEYSRGEWVKICECETKEDAVREVDNLKRRNGEHYRVICCNDKQILEIV